MINLEGGLLLGGLSANGLDQPFIPRAFGPEA
jgi:hypothetical protein